MVVIMCKCENLQTPREVAPARRPRAFMSSGPGRRRGRGLRHGGSKEREFGGGVGAPVPFAFAPAFERRFEGCGADRRGTYPQRPRVSKAAPARWISGTGVVGQSWASIGLKKGRCACLIFAAPLRPGSSADIIRRRHPKARPRARTGALRVPGRSARHRRDVG